MPHAVPIKKSAPISARLLAAPTPRGYALNQARHPIAPPALPLLMTLSLIWWGLLPLLLLVAVIDCLTMSQSRRVRMLRRSGLTQGAIADRLQISRYRVRLALA